LPDDVSETTLLQPSSGITRKYGDSLLNPFFGREPNVAAAAQSASRKSSDQGFSSTGSVIFPDSLGADF
jgi:hypothetical protein